MKTHLADLSHRLDQVLHNSVLHNKYLQKMSVEWLFFVSSRIWAGQLLRLEAIRENQIVAVLLHRIDEELLQRTFLHSVTS